MVCNIVEHVKRPLKNRQNNNLNEDPLCILVFRYFVSQVSYRFLTVDNFRLVLSQGVVSFMEEGRVGSVKGLKNIFS